MAKMRREEIADAFERQSIPPPITEPKTILSAIDLAGHAIKHVKTIDVGGTTKVLYQLPEADRNHAIAIANLYDNQIEMGRYGDTKRVTDHFQVDAGVASKVHDGLVVDYIANELSNRRGNDNDLPLPELTRRDVLAAAFDAND